MTYYEIIKNMKGDKETMWREVYRISQLLESVRSDEAHKDLIEGYLMITEAEMSGHYNEELAYKVVEKMNPVFTTNLKNYMDSKGLTIKKVYDTVKTVEKNIINAYAQKGLEIPPIHEEYNMYDYYVCMADKLDHHYASIGEDINKGALLVYESLSNHDGSTRYIWDKTKKYLDNV